LKLLGKVTVNSQDTEFYWRFVVPHVTLHGCLLENTTKIFKAIADVVWKPDYLNNLISKKLEQIVKLQVKVAEETRRRVFSYSS